jgi:hypothetical protein
MSAPGTPPTQRPLAGHAAPLLLGQVPDQSISFPCQSLHLLFLFLFLFPQQVPDQVFISYA